MASLQTGYLSHKQLHCRKPYLATRAWHSSHSVCTRRPLQTSHQLEQLQYEIITSLALPGEPCAAELQRWSRNIDVLREVHGAARTERVRTALLANPSLLSADLELWHNFLVTGFGLPPDSFAKLTSDCPTLLTRGDIFTAGAVMLFFKGMGWRNKDIAQRIIGYYPQLLLLDRVRDINPVLVALEALECRGDDLRLLVWEFPRIFDKDFRRHIRKFQTLGVYGLSLRTGGGGGRGGGGGGDGGGYAKMPQGSLGGGGDGNGLINGGSHWAGEVGAGPAGMGAVVAVVAAGEVDGSVWLGPGSASGRKWAGGQGRADRGGGGLDDLLVW